MDNNNNNNNNNIYIIENSQELYKDFQNVKKLYTISSII